jgi:hypothetical protein
MPKGKLVPVNNAFAYLWGHATNDDIVALNRLMKKGYKVFWASANFTANGKTYPPGTMIVRNSKGLVEEMKSIVKNLSVRFEGIKARPGVKAYALKPVRLGLYKSWTASMDEGWTRWVLEQYEFPYESVFDKDIRKGNIHRSFDVLLFPDLRTNAIINGIPEGSVPPKYAGGIGEIGVKNIKEFIQRGGTLITLNSAADFPIKQFYLTVENNVESVERKDFFIPGSILQTLIDPTHPIAYGYERGEAVFFRRSPVFSAREGRSVARYPLHNPLLSGWVNGEKYLYNKSAIVDVPFGKGKIILLGFPVLYRAQAHGTFRFLFNSIYYGAASRSEL